MANGNDYPGDPTAPDDRMVARMTYAGQQRDQCIFANGARVVYRHDGAGRIIEIAHSDSNASLLAIQYLYDAASNVRVRNDVLPTGPRTERFAYDSLYRLANEFKPDTTEDFDLSNFGPASALLANPIPNRQSAMTTLIGSLGLPQTLVTFDYDLVGNRDIERTADGTSIDYEANSLDQYISRNGTNYTYDANGNLNDDQERMCTYDSLNRLVIVKEKNGNELTNFWHDALGRRILERINGKATQLICDGNNVIEEYRDGNLFAQYIFDDGVDSLLQIAAEKRDHWYHTDIVGSVRLLTEGTGANVAQYDYSPFGAFEKETNKTIYNPWGYTARRFNPSLRSYDYRAREYNPQTGRFFQRDPAEMIDGTNLYKYTENNPLSYIDPFGLERDEAQLASNIALITETLISEGIARGIEDILTTGRLKYQEVLTQETLNKISYERIANKPKYEYNGRIRETYTQGADTKKIRAQINNYHRAGIWPRIFRGAGTGLVFATEGWRRYVKGEGLVHGTVGTIATASTAIATTTKVFKNSRVSGWGSLVVSAVDIAANYFDAPEEFTDATGFAASSTVVGIASQGVSDFVDTSALLLGEPSTINEANSMIHRQATSSTPAAGYSLIGMSIFGGNSDSFWRGGWGAKSDLSRFVGSREDTGFFSSVGESTSDRAIRVSNKVGGGTLGDILAVPSVTPGAGILMEAAVDNNRAAFRGLNIILKSL